MLSSSGRVSIQLKLRVDIEASRAVAPQERLQVASPLPG
jgi:hypothetical protein